MAQVLQFQSRFARQPGWTQNELAEFYRVESALAQAGLHLETEQGVTDEGDPWFVFCRHDSGEIFIHFARIDGEFIIDGFGYESVARGRDFAALVRELISSELFAVAKSKPKTGNVFLHPAALLIMLVGTAFLHSSEAKAAETQDKGGEPRRVGGFVHLLGSSASELLPSDMDAVQAAALVAGAVLASEPQALSIAPPPPAAPSGVTNQITSDADIFAQAPSLQSTAIRPVHESSSSLADSTAALPAEHFAAPATYLAPDLLAADITISVTPMEPMRTFVASAPVAPPGIISMLGGLDGVFLPASTPAALPADEAGALLQGLTTQDHPVISLSGSLPTQVLGLMQNGLHVAASAPTVEAAPAPEVSSPAPVPNQDVNATAPDPNAVAPPPSAPAPVAQTVFHDPGVDTAIAQFIANAPNWEVIVSGRDLVVYDAAIFAPHPAEALDSVTFTFADGSSVSLVGTAQELVFAHTVH